MKAHLKNQRVAFVKKEINVVKPQEVIKKIISESYLKNQKLITSSERRSPKSTSNFGHIWTCISYSTPYESTSEKSKGCFCQKGKKKHGEIATDHLKKITKTAH